MRFKSFNDRFETVFPCTTNFMFICETLSKAVAAFGICEILSDTKRDRLQRTVFNLSYNE